MERLQIYAGNEPKSCLHDLGDCRDNERNSQSVFLLVYAGNEPKSVLVAGKGFLLVRGYSMIITD